MKKVNEQLFNKLYKVALSSRFADGDEVVDKFEEKGEPTKDNTSDKAKAEFADGEEVAQNFNGDEDSEKMLETSSEKYKVKFIVGEYNYALFDSNIDGVLDNFSDIIEEHSLYIEDEEDGDGTHEGFIEFKNLGTEKDLDKFEEALEDIGVGELQRMDFKASKRCETSEDGEHKIENDKEFVIIDKLTDNVYSKEGFIELPEEEQYSEAIKFDSKEDAIKFLEDFKEEPAGRYIVLPVEEVFAFAGKEVCPECKQEPCVCGKEDDENPIYKKASETLRKLAFDKGYTNIYEMLDKEDNLFAKYPDELAEIIADKTTTEEEAGEVFEAVERMIGEK